MLLLKGVVFWAPALFFWSSLAWGSPILDFRTDEEVQDDENEVRRLERFFDVEGLSQAEYLSEWTVKEEALSNMVDKLFRSQRFMDALARGPDEAADAEEGSAGDMLTQRSQSRKSGQFTPDLEAVEVSYVLPPPLLEESPADEAVESSDATGPRPWYPRLVVAHRDGGLALITLGFEYVTKGKDREERWACTTLRADLVATFHGEAASECICDLQGPLPHGVRYMRI